MNKKQLKERVIEPTLKQLGLYSSDAVELLLMIAAHESVKGEYIAQITGPARGIYQMEGATHDSILDWMEAKKPSLDKAIMSLVTESKADTMMYDLRYATAMARVFFLRFPEALPSGSDVDAMAAYAKRRWNTSAGKATPADYKNAYLSWK
ncbi:endolysin [Pantoea phage Nufs112]|nr:endolysin [Pantoea phage Nufs112]